MDLWVEGKTLNRQQLVILCEEQHRGKYVSLHRFRSRPLWVMVGRFEYHEHRSAGRKHGKIISTHASTYLYDTHTDTFQVYVLQHFSI